MARVNRKDDISSGDVEHVEYKIYAYLNPADQEDGENDWEKLDTTTNREKALKDAEELSSSDKYQRVEVKKKFKDNKSDRMRDMTLKVFEKKPKRSITLAVLVLFVVFFGVMASLTYFFSA